MEQWLLNWGDDIALLRLAINRLLGIILRILVNWLMVNWGGLVQEL